MAESEEELKSLLMNMKEESEKLGLKLNIQKSKIMVSGPIQFSSVQSLSHIQLFVTPWTAARQASLSITNSQSSPKLLVPLLHGKYMRIQWKEWENLFSWGLKSLQMVTADMKLKDAYSLEEKLWPT